jgi:hypothetical protein
MCRQSKIYQQLTLEIAKSVFHANSIPLFFKKLDRFIQMLELPTRYTTFKQIGEINEQDIN